MVPMEKPTSGIVSSIFWTAVYFVVNLYYDVNVVDVFPPTKSDATLWWKSDMFGESDTFVEPDAFVIPTYIYYGILKKTWNKGLEL
jgi:hypothetical protein